MHPRMKSIRLRKTARSVRAALGVERLESRTLLAGLMNVGDSIIRLEPHIGAQESFDQISRLGAGAQNQIDNEKAREDCHHREDEGDENCQTVDLGTEGADGLSTPSPQQSMRTDQPVRQIEPAHTNPFIVPVALPVNKLPQTNSLASSTEPSISESAPFHYFAEIGAAVDEEGPSLDREPLVNQAVQETYFAVSLLENSNLSPVTASVDDEAGVTDGTKNANRVPLVEVKQPWHQDAVVNARAIHPDAKAAIALAEEAIRYVDALVSLPNTEATDIAITQVFNQPPEVAIVLKPEITGSHRIQSTSFNQGWQLGLFGVLSMVVSARSIPNKKLNPDPTQFDQRRRKDQC